RASALRRGRRAWRPRARAWAARWGARRTTRARRTPRAPPPGCRRPPGRGRPPPSRGPSEQAQELLLRLVRAPPHGLRPLTAERVLDDQERQPGHAARGRDVRRQAAERGGADERRRRAHL